MAEEVGPIDVVVNNAGITRDGVLHRMSFEDWNEVMRVNLGGCFNMAKATFPRHARARLGADRQHRLDQRPDGAVRPGQLRRRQIGHPRLHQGAGTGRRKFGVTVNAIAPGYIDTDMVAAVPPPVLEKIVAKVPVGRLGQASEIARGVNFLYSENGGFVTGSTLSINGGQHMY